MTAGENGRTIDDAFRFKSHAMRPEILGEVHARPFHMLTTPRTVIHLAFMTGADGGAADREAITRLCQTRGSSGPDAAARHHSIAWGSGMLRWEKHLEFSTYAWDGPGSDDRTADLPGYPFGGEFPAPGEFISGVRLEIRNSGEDADQPILADFDPVSLCYSDMENGLARAVTDFRQDSDGLTRILILDRGLGAARAGALAQRLIEVETYRTLAMLGLPNARVLSAELDDFEIGLTGITTKLQMTKGSQNEALLEELVALAADLEASAAANLYRFGASRAYDEIISGRLAAIGEVALPGYETWHGFLARRLRPAMRTCRSAEERQANLSTKLARVAMLLRTRVDVELERQNRNLLASMNRRARLQLRLQQTVEGLSIAAVSYYIVGLINYLAKGAQSAGILAGVNTALVTALSVPPVVLALWWVVRGIRKVHHGD